MTVRPEDVQATFCATLVDEWVRRGLRHAVVAPGSRSTPMALALAGRREVALHVFHDERSAAFAALGIGLASGVPSALLCTSGTAATHFHAAVVEAHLAGVPLLVLTADRPPELHGIGAPQTIDQQHLYTSAAKFADAGVADQADISSWRVRAAEWLPTGGPMHVNLPFREPLVGAAHDLPPADGRAPHDEMAAPLAADAEAPAVLHHERGVIVAGRGVDRPDLVGALADVLGWPILSDPRSGCRGLPASVSAFDALLRHDRFAAEHLPQTVLHLGEPPASKVLGQWLQRSGAHHVQVLGRQATIDPLQLIDVALVGPVGAICAAWSASLRSAAGPAWLASWLQAEQRAQRAVDEVISRSWGEPAVARCLTARPQQLVVSSSMPIRDVEWFGHPGGSAPVHSNRGANGIDGVVATAIGVALATRAPTTVLLGDVALCHDASSLTALASRDVELKIVVVDNDGGGIFSFLPQASQLDPVVFDRLFGTPHGTDVVALAGAHGLRSCTAASAVELQAALDQPGTALIRTVSERSENVAEHQRLNAAVAAALG
jgi:2-succinyl-5-enolpyruvyl-6-hydroxy-3-cyclohexene-1-carboxylate synthase